MLKKVLFSIWGYVSFILFRRKHKHNTQREYFTEKETNMESIFLNIGKGTDFFFEKQAQKMNINVDASVCD